MSIGLLWKGGNLVDSALNRPVLDEDIGFLFERPAWHAQAACRGMDRAIFFPERGARNSGQEAKAVCAACPVTAECGEAGARESSGIWGGMSARQRRDEPGYRHFGPSPISLRRK